MKKLIQNGLVLLYSDEGWRLEKKDIVLSGNRIEAVTSCPEPGDYEIIDASRMVVMPGLVNAHTHAYMSMHRNFADDLAFFEWLDKVMLVEDEMNVTDIYWATLLSIIEMIKTGTTCFVDMTLKSAEEKTGPMSAASGAAFESGMRAVINRGLAGTADADMSLMKFGQAIREMEIFKDEPRVQFMHGPHAPYSCMADYLKKSTRSCKEHGIRQTIHLSESETEMENMFKEHGMTPIQYVDSLGFFDVPVIAAHCVYATDADIQIMKKKGVSVAVNPKSNMKLGNGFAPVEKFLKAGLNVCLGTDGPGSNNSLNMFQEMNTAALVYKGANKKAQCVDAADVLKMATVNGAKAIGLEGELGEIKEGALADLIMLRLDEPQFMPASNVLSGLVYSATGSEVDTVLVDGKVLMQGRKLTTIDEEKVYSECAKIAKRLHIKQVSEVKFCK